MAQYNYSSNIDTDKYYMTDYGAGNISRDANNVYTVNTVGTADREAYVRFDAENLGIGDIMRVEYDANAVGAISAQLRYTDPSTGTTSTKSTYTVDINGLYDGEITFVADKPGGYTISVGGGWNTDLDGTISNISIVIESNSAYADTRLPKFQRFTIYTPSLGDFQLRSDWSTHEATLTQYDANTLLLEPTLEGVGRYQVFVNSMIDGNSPDYLIRGWIDVYNGITLSFYNPVDNTPIPLANVAQYVTFGVLLI